MEALCAGKETSRKIYTEATSKSKDAFRLKVPFADPLVLLNPRKILFLHA
jgi:hypothetical protein